MADEEHTGAPVLRKTDDFDAVRSLALASGLEDGTFEDIVTAFGCYIHGKMVGCVALKVSGDKHSVEWLAVTDGLRRMGLGRMLVAKVESEARLRGADRIWALARAPRFFESIGFRVASPHEVGSPTMSNCFLCSQYQRSCFPAVVVKQF